MFKNNLLFTLLFVVLFAQLSTAQKFLTETFTEITVTNDVTYGVNATVIAFSQVGEAIPQELKMDIYEPVGDDATERPLALVFHTGNFLPSVTNGGITGLKTDSSTIEICTRLAKMGYTAAAVDYRLGWNPLAGTQPERALGLIQAAYRGIQDGRTAVRFFKDDYNNGGNNYSVDPNRIVSIGTGTGGYLVLGMATLDEYTEIVTTTNGPGKFLLDLDADGTPETPMVVPAYHGDIEGKALTVTPDNAFGLPAGDTTCYPNFVDESSDIQLVMNVGGALGDVSWMDANSVPIISVQSAYDIFAPYEDAVLIVPTTGDPIVQVQGGKVIAETQDGLGLNQSFIDAGVTDVYTDKAVAHSAVAGHPFYEALYPVVNAPNSNGLDEGVVIDWWNADDASPVGSAGGGATWEQIPHPSGGTFHTQGLLLNEGMSAEKSKLNIDTILAFYAPRAFETLNLGELVSNENIEANEVSLLVAPNPVGNEVVLTSDAETPMQSVQVFDINGRLVRDYQNVNNNYFFMTRGNLPSGTYVMMIGFENGEVSKKLILK
ncbi:MAG: acetyl esterase/lipase [Maribacter sp.]|jgi:acetyl esterase/lipase